MFWYQHLYDSRFNFKKVWHDYYIGKWPPMRRFSLSLQMPAADYRLKIMAAVQLPRKSSSLINTAFSNAREIVYHFVTSAAAQKCRQRELALLQ